MRRSLLLDTNLLLFFLVTQVDLSILRSFKRVSQFRTSDLVPLRDLVEAFSALIATPHVLTEVSNFVDQAPLQWRSHLIFALRRFAEDQEERYERASSLAVRNEFQHLALTDTGLLSLSTDAVVATLDFELYHRILAAGGAAVHFDEVRGNSSSRLLPGACVRMPELPEVETVAKGVHARVHGQRIESVWTSGKPQTFKSPESEIAEVLTGATIESVRRVGKTIVMTLTREIDGGADPVPAEFLVHLGMTGRLLVSSPEVPRPPHTHAALTLSGGNELRFVDARRFGRLSVRSEAYAGPGAEPLSISEDDFVALFRGRKTPIKAALLNQSLLAGVGNIYADESLFRAGIRPKRQAGRITRAELLRLRKALIAVLKHAIKLGGSSVSDYVDADGVRGFFQLEHKVYGRAGDVCKDCGSPLKKLIVGGRTTVYCPTCQH